MTFRLHDPASGGCITMDRAWKPEPEGVVAPVDLVVLVADRTLANCIHNLVGFEVDVPSAEPLEAESVV
jgi:hypothetical protein